MLNRKANETKNLFEGLSSNKKNEPGIDKSIDSEVDIVNDVVENKDVDINKNNNKDCDANNFVNEDVNVNVNNDVNDNINNDADDGISDDIIENSDIFSSLLENDNEKIEYVRATHYFRKDQLADIAKFAKKAKKGKNEFMRDIMDLVFTQLKKN